MAGFICEGARPGDDTDHSLLVDGGRHDSNFALIRGDDTGAVGANEPGFVLPREGVFDAHHVLEY